MATDATHRHVAPELALYAIDAVSGDERAVVEEHVAACAACNAEFRRLREAATTALASDDRRDLDACWDRILLRVRGRISPA